MSDSGSSGGVDFNDDAYALKSSLRFDGESDDGDTVYSAVLEAFSQEFSERFFMFDESTLTSAYQPFENDAESISLSSTLEHYFSYEQVLSIRSYFDYYDRNLGEVSDIQTSIANIQAEYEHTLLDRNTLNWAIEYSYIHEALEDSFTFDFNAAESIRHLFSVGLENTLEVVENQFYLIPSCKVEFHNQTYTELLGSFKAKWLPSNRQTYWASIARAIRTPSLAERWMTSSLPDANGQADLVVVEPNDDLQSEQSLSYEFGVVCC